MCGWGYIQVDMYVGACVCVSFHPHSHVKVGVSVCLSTYLCEPVFPRVFICVDVSLCLRRPLGLHMRW